MTAELEPVFASTFLYAACKVVGIEQFPDYLKGQLATLDDSAWPALRTMGQLSRICTYELWVDASTYIDRARCVAAARFLESGKDVWLTLDDDIETDEGVLRRLLAACRETRGGVAVPYVNRDGKSMTFRKVYGQTEYVCGSIPVRYVDRVGFGIVALHRELVVQLADKAVWFRENDQPTSRRCPHLFVNDVDEGVWTGEDYAFSKRCELAGRPLRALLDAPVCHAGIDGMLDVNGDICIARPEHASVLDGALRAREAKANAVHADTGQTTEPNGV